MTLHLLEILFAAAAVLAAAAIGTVGFVGLLVCLSGWRRRR